MAHAALGETALLVLAWLFSEDRWRVPWRTVIAGVALQVALAVLLLDVPPAVAVGIQPVVVTIGGVASPAANLKVTAAPVAPSGN